MEPNAPVRTLDCGAYLPQASCLHAIAAHGFTVNVPTGTRTIYLQVGVGTFTGTLQGGGSPGVNATVNTVSVTVPAAQVGSGDRAGDDHEQRGRQQLLGQLRILHRRHSFTSAASTDAPDNSAASPATLTPTVPAR